jgi:hypothetical protein
MITIILSALLWRWQGGGLITYDPPGRRVWYVIAVLTAIAFATTGWKIAGLFGLSLLWITLIPHGRWFDFGHMDAPADKADAFEGLIEKLFPSDALRMFAVITLAFLPLAILAAPITPLLAYSGYWLGWKHWDGDPKNNPTRWGEWTSGAAIGLCLWSIS